MSRTQTSIAAVTRWRDGAHHYGRVSRINHWLVAALVIAMLGSGLALEYASLAQGPAASLRDWHKAAGVIALLAILARVGWRLIQGFPGGTGGPMPVWQEKAARAVHWALLVTIVAMPVSGVLMTLFVGRPIDVLGLTIPAAPQVGWLAQAARSIHATAGLALAGLVAIHVGAALKHHLIGRDGTLGRMVSGPRRSGGPATRPDPVAEAEAVRL